jgi:hypothetical protein
MCAAGLYTPKNQGRSNLEADGGIPPSSRMEFFAGERSMGLPPEAKPFLAVVANPLLGSK